MKKKNEISIRSSAAEYLTFIAATGDDKEAIEVRYEDENIWLTQKMLSASKGLDEVTVNTYIQEHSILKDKFIEKGGYDNIKGIMDTINIKTLAEKSYVIPINLNITCLLSISACIQLNKSK